MPAGDNLLSLTRAVPSRRRTFAAIALSAAAYLYVFPYAERINNPNENARLYMTAAIVELGTYRIDDLRARWGWVNDCAIYEGHVYSVKAPGTSLLGVPAYAAYYAYTEWRERELDRTTALWLCRVTGSVLPWLVFLAFFYPWLGRQTSSPVVRDAVFFSIAIGSCLFGYGVTFVSHTLSAAAAFGSFMLLTDAKHAGRMRNARAFFAGLLAAGVSMLEYPGFVASAILCVYALVAVRPWARLIPFALGAAIPTLAVMHFQWASFGSPFTPGHLYVETETFRTQHEQGFFGAVGVSWDALGGLLIDPEAGLFPMTPVLAFAAIGAVIVCLRQRERAPAIAALTIAIATTLVISAMNNWRGGWTIGPRYLAVVYPFLGWLAVVGLDRIAARAPSVAGALALGTTAVAFVVSGLPSAYYPHYPPEVDRPFAQIVSVLIAHDFAPFNAGHLLGVYGTVSMIPFALVAIACLLLATFAPKDWSERAIVLAGGALVALAIGWPLNLDPRPEEPEVRAALGFVTRMWDPPGHDLASQLEEQMRGEPDVEGYERLAEVYEREGRDREAQAARSRAARLSRQAVSR